MEDNIIAAKGAQATIIKLYRHCVCDRAETGKEAVNMAQHNLYDFILMDIGLPDIDGIEATRQIRAFHSPNQAKVPIIALTGHASNWDKREEALAAGMNDVFEKPLTESKLELLMQHYVFNPRQHEASIEKPQSEKTGIQKIIPVIDWTQCLEQFNGDETFVRELLASLAIDLKFSQEK
ncbi:response regulator [Legionella tunisiensis]|uniref:response regulator n=1 Tax=Legionella tunisiensis TaxID=1034944 RepID=UPI0002F095C4|nr:response regulator [Legionella tunisiensis]